MDAFLKAHIEDLARRAETQNRFTFSDFLSPEEYGELSRMRQTIGPFDSFGGMENCERCILRFGSPASLGYEEPFPIDCLKIMPKNEKFAETLSHRDYLGAIMGLGVERKNVGDIIVRGKTAYVFVLSKLADYFSENLTQIRKTDVVCTRCESLPEGALYETVALRLTVSSCRIDCVVAAVSRLSRSKSDALFREKKVFLNGAVCEKPDTTLSPGDRFSIRGIGKFCFSDTLGSSKKGKNVIEILIYK